MHAKLLAALVALLVLPLGACSDDSASDDSGVGDFRFADAEGDGAGPGEELVHLSVFVYDVAVDETHVYFATADGVQRVAKTGGTPETLVSDAGQVYDLELDAGHVYWVDRTAGVVARVPKAGGAQTVYDDEAADPERLHVDASHVYWTAEDGLFRAPIAGDGDAEQLDAAFNAAGVDGDATHVYWCARGLTSKVIWRLEKASGTAEQLGEVPLDGSCGDLLLAGDNVLFTQLDGPGGAGSGGLAKIAKAGGTATVAADAQRMTGYLAADTDAVYWTIKSGTGAPDGGLMRATLAGGAAALFAGPVKGHIGGVAADDAHVYFLAPSLLKIDK